jgi:hypothetical protein
MKKRMIAPALAAIAGAALLVGPAAAQTFQINVTMTDSSCKLALNGAKTPNTSIDFHLTNNVEGCRRPDRELPQGGNLPLRLHDGELLPPEALRQGRVQDPQLAHRFRRGGDYPRGMSDVRIFFCPV